MSASTAAASAVVSSSSTLWATASKEWVIPAKPKPGRKPKKDPAPAENDAELDSKGRRVQNRAAQRAFRERKQSQLAELQARVQQYEQGEIERNVALQNIAKRLKEENEKLRAENTMLKEKVARIEEERSALRDVAKKRSREDSLPLSPKISSDDFAKKKAKLSFDPPPVQAPLIPFSHASSPSSLTSSPRSNSSSHTSFSPFPALPEPREAPVIPQGNSLGSLFDFVSASKTNLFEPGEPLDTFNCGFCSENTPCVCRELAMQQVSERIAQVNSESLKVEAMDHSAHTQPSTQYADSQQSILDNLPAFQPAVPLRRRNPNSSQQPIFPVSQPPSAPSDPRTPTCSGDPSNCLACADDAFGKAFCAAISTVASTQCEDCPGRSQAAGSGPPVGCCGNPALCGQSSCGSSDRAAAVSTSASVAMSTDEPSNSETMPCDDAWRQIKSHPNVEFTDLALLAEVVARRSKCTGPRVEISPAPGTVTPERGISPLSFQVQPQQAGTNHEPVLLRDPHAQYHEKQRGRAGSPPQLVPQEVLIRCGRQRVREVLTEGVRDALRLLDAKFSLP